MRLAILSDVHANLEALRAVVADSEHQKVEKLFFLGDAVGYGADPNKCVRLLCDLCEVMLMGNHDYVALGLESPQYFNLMAQQSILWTQKMLDRKAIERMSEFGQDSTFLDYYFVHATPDNPVEWNYLLTADDAARSFEYFSQTVCFVGHSHLPMVFHRQPDGRIVCPQDGVIRIEPPGRYIVNVGSVGQPRDGIRDACYLIIDTAEQTLAYRRVPYDLHQAQEKMKKARLPEFLITRLACGR